jgi:hypothetical protein
LALILERALERRCNASAVVAGKSDSVATSDRLTSSLRDVSITRDVIDTDQPLRNYWTGTTEGIRLNEPHA